MSFNFSIEVQNKVFNPSLTVLWKRNNCSNLVEYLLQDWFLNIENIGIEYAIEKLKYLFGCLSGKIRIPNIACQKFNQKFNF